METAEANRALLIAKSRAIQSDIAGETQLADNVATAADNYESLSNQGADVAGELEAELGYLLAIDFKSMLNADIPIVSRIGILKKPIGKILDLAKKIGTIVDEIQDAKKVLESTQQQTEQGDDLDELPKPAIKNAADLQFALKDIKDSFIAFEGALTKLKTEIESFESFEKFAGEGATAENEEHLVGILTGITGAARTIVDDVKNIVHQAGTYTDSF